MDAIIGLTAVALVAIGGVFHIVHRRRFVTLLERHGSWTRPLRALPALELLLPILVVIGLASDTPVLTAAGALGVAALSLGFTVWVLRLVITRSALACACSTSTAPASWLGVARAAVGIAAVALLAVDQLGSVDLVMGSAIATAAAAAIYALPDALAWPRFARALSEHTESTTYESVAA